MRPLPLCSAKLTTVCPSNPANPTPRLPPWKERGALELSTTAIDTGTGPLPVGLWPPKCCLGVTRTPPEPRNHGWVRQAVGTAGAQVGRLQGPGLHRLAGGSRPGTQSSSGLLPCPGRARPAGSQGCSRATCTELTSPRNGTEPTELAK